jgi:hypothetical protein
MEGEEMKTRIFIIIPFLFVVIISLFWIVQETEQSSEEDRLSLNLSEPLFVSQARAESNWLNEYLDEEAGLAAWVRGDLIDLAEVEPLLNVEYITSEYIIGGLKQALPGYSEAESPHIYASVDGWIMAYYNNTDVASKIVDIVYFRTYQIMRTKLQVAIDIITTAVGSPILSAEYYDFRYINATNMMTIAETDQDGNNYFYVEVPSDFTVYEYSYSIYGNGDGVIAINIMWINDVEYRRCYPYCYDTITPSMLPYDVSNKISYNDEGSISILYEEQP